MKKIVLTLSIVMLTMSQIVYAAGMTTEKDIGPCTHRNIYGFCSQSKTHYCASFSKSNGRCVMWYSKSKSDFDNAMEQFNAFNQGVNDELKKTNTVKSKKTTVNKSTPNIVKAKSKVTSNKQSVTSNIDTKFQAEEKATIPNSLKIAKSITVIDNKIQYLQRRESEGIDVTNELNLLEYKSTKLWQLENLREKFSILHNNYQNKIISKAEYDEMIAKLRKADTELYAPYKQIMSTTVESMQKEEAEQKAKIEAEQKRERKKEIGRRLLNQGSLYVPPAASNWINQGADVLELFSK